MKPRIYGSHLSKAMPVAQGEKGGGSYETITYLGYHEGRMKAQDFGAVHLITIRTETASATRHSAEMEQVRRTVVGDVNGGNDR